MIEKAWLSERNENSVLSILSFWWGGTILQWEIQIEETEGRYETWKICRGSESGISGDRMEWTTFKFTLECEVWTLILFGVRR